MHNDCAALPRPGHIGLSIQVEEPNGFAEQLIGSIRRECVDHMIVLGEVHLHWILSRYAAYYNELRTHRSLGKDAPVYRAIQHVGRIASMPVLGGLHHHYCRI